MGLDIIACSKKNAMFENVDAPNEWFVGTEELVRGCFGDVNWIRGKYYYYIINELTGVNLYQEEINNKTVNHIATVLENQKKDWHSVDSGYHYSIEEIKMLAKWFRAAADNGCFLEGWW